MSNTDLADDLVLTENAWLCPTAAGAFYAVASPQQNGTRAFLQRLLLCDATPRLNSETLVQLTHLELPHATRFLYQLQSTAYVQQLPSRQERPRWRLDDLADALPPLLAKCSDSAKLVLVDHHGVVLARCGCSDKLAQRWASLALGFRPHFDEPLADDDDFSYLTGSGLGFCHWRGYSQWAVWPIYWRRLALMLVVSGLPRFNRHDYMSVIWGLSPLFADGQQAPGR